MRVATVTARQDPPRSGRRIEWRLCQERIPRPASRTRPTVAGMERGYSLPSHGSFGLAELAIMPENDGRDTERS
jgi:hypothetical protein